MGEEKIVKVVFCQLLCLDFLPNQHTSTNLLLIPRGSLTGRGSVLCMIFVALRGILPNKMLVEAEEEILLRFKFHRNGERNSESKLSFPGNVANLYLPQIQ